METEPSFKAKAYPLIPEIAVCRVEVRGKDLAIHAPAETIAGSLWAARDTLKRAAGAYGFGHYIYIYAADYGLYGPPIDIAWRENES